MRTNENTTHEYSFGETPSQTADDPAGERWMTVEEIATSYAEYAEWIDRLGWLDRLLTGDYRRKQFGDVSGRVLDVACGAGTNFSYLPATVDIVGIDVSPEMLARARERLDRFDGEARVQQMDAQEMAFDDASFDTVISSFSTCTFPEPRTALREMERVCRPDGRILLAEHGKSDVGPVARYQEWRAESQYRKSGCRVTQEPLEVVRSAGLNVVASDTGQLGRITTIEARPR